MAPCPTSRRLCLNLKPCKRRFSARGRLLRRWGRQRRRYSRSAASAQSIPHARQDIDRLCRQVDVLCRIDGRQKMIGTRGRNPHAAMGRKIHLGVGYRGDVALQQDTKSPIAAHRRKRAPARSVQRSASGRMAVRTSHHGVHRSTCGGARDRRQRRADHPRFCAGASDRSLHVAEVAAVHTCPEASFAPELAMSQPTARIDSPAPARRGAFALGIPCRHDRRSADHVSPTSRSGSENRPGRGRATASAAHLCPSVQ